jgi:triacylglycerol esterase/lipase EstA (alpha/beta hydrolase family)
MLQSNKKTIEDRGRRRPQRLEDMMQSNKSTFERFVNPHRASSVAALLLAAGAAACSPTDDSSDDQPAAEEAMPDADPISVTAPINSYFDPATGTGYADGYRVVGSTTPASFSWGKIDLLEGTQKYRTEGYNLRTAKLRYQDTYQDDTYPLQTYFGKLNQELVDGFNLFYKDSCAGAAGSTGAGACAEKGPTRPEARFVLLQHGPKTAKNTCDTSKTPVLLVHGALQNGNVWLYPGGNDGAGNAYPGTTQTTGFVQALEAENICTYAVTFGSFHGDNFNQAINLANAIDRVKTVTGRPKVNVVAWSKGVLSVDLYAGNVASWQDWGSRYFEQIAAEQAKAVPAFRKDIRTYVALSGPHLGIDLNFRHPFDDLLIYSTAENAPLGQGPVTWGNMSAIQCVTWGFVDSPSSFPFGNPFAYSVCEGRGGTWLDYWNRIYTSNIVSLDIKGQPVYQKSLKTLNTEQGLASSAFQFDKYNLAMWGSIDTSGKLISAYLGQLQAAYDLRPSYPIPNRQNAPISDDWSTLDTDETKWRDWLSIKVSFNPASPFGGAGFLKDDSAHKTCRTTAFDPVGSPCKAEHLYYNARTAESYSFGYARYKLMDGIGINAVMEMGGNFIERLRHHGLSPDLDALYVLYGTSSGAAGSIFEIDGMACPTCDPHGDGVLFDVSIAAQDQLTQGWSAADKSSKSKQEGVPFGHLDMGVTKAVWDKMIAAFKAAP